MSSESSHQKPQFEAIPASVRFGFASIVLGLSYPNIRLALAIDKFNQIYQDMLNGKPLPYTTIFVLHAQPFLVFLSILIPLIATILLFVGRYSRSTFTFGLLILLVFIQLFFTWQAISAPLFAIISAMQQG